MARILYVNQWFLPENASRGMQLIHGLQAAGHEVEALTGFPNYPTGKLFPGYTLKPYMKDMIVGVAVHRVFLVPSHSRSSVGRAANYVSFFISVLIFLLIHGRKYDLAYVYHPPITVGLATALAGLLTRRPFILEVQDLWPESVAVSGMNGTSWMARVLGPVCAFVYQRAAAVLGQSRGMTSRLIERGARPDRAQVLFNWADEETVRQSGEYDLESLNFEGRFNFVFGGNMGLVQGLETVIEAAALAAHRVPEVQLTLIGDGVERDALVRFAGQIGAINVQFRPAAPQDQISNVFAAADVLLVHLRDDPLFEITIPSKTQFYLAMAKPILIGMNGEATDIVVQAGAGLASPPMDAEAMAEMMVRMARMPKTELDAMGRRAGEAYSRDYSLAAAQATVDAAVRQALGAAEATNGERPMKSLMLKRAMDLVVAAAALILLAVPILIIALLVRVNMGAPVLFRQVRPGLEGKPFLMWKFRTMRSAGRGEENLPDRQRITPLGRFLRATSLDELPELWNVLCGDMSLVGPRPLLMEYLPRYTVEQMRRHAVRPGVTGWAQVNGRNAISWEEKFARDTWYVNNRTIWLDIKILVLTAWALIKPRGIESGGASTMPTFLGTRPEGVDQSAEPL